MGGLASTMGIGVILSFMTHGIGNVTGAAASLKSLFLTTRNGTTVLSDLGKVALLTLGSIVALKIGIETLNVAMANVQVAADYEESMARLQGITETPAESMGMFRDAAEDLARTSRSTASEIAQGMYEIASAGYEGQQVIDIMRASILLADTGELDMAAASETVTKALHAFSIPASQAIETTNMLGRAVAITQLHFDDLEQGLGTFGQTAYASGQSVEEMLALYGSFVTSGLRPSRAATMVKMMLTSLMGATPTSRAFMESIGVEYIDPATGRLRSLLDIIEDVKSGLDAGTIEGTIFEDIFGEITNDTEEAEATFKGLVAMFGRRAISGYFGTTEYMYETTDATYQGVDALREMADQILNNNGFMEEYHETVMDTWNAQKDVLESNIDLLRLQLGQGMLTALRPLLDFIVESIQKVTAFLQAYPQVAAAIGGGVGILGMAITVGGIILTILTVIQALTAPLGTAMAQFAGAATLGKAIVALFAKAAPVLGTIGIVIGAILLIVASIVTFWDSFKAGFAPIIEHFVTIFSPIYEQLKPLFAALMQLIGFISKAALVVVLGLIASVLYVIVLALGTVYYLIKYIFEFFIDIFASLIALWNLLTGQITVEEFLSVLNRIWASFGDELFAWFSGPFAQGVIAFFTTLWEQIKTILGFGSNPSPATVSALQFLGFRYLPPGSRPSFASGSYSIPVDGFYQLHEDEQVVQSGQHPYTNQNSGNTFTIGNMQLQVVSSGNADYDANALFDAFMRRMKAESQRAM